MSCDRVGALGVSIYKYICTSSTFVPQLAGAPIAGRKSADQIRTDIAAAAIDVIGRLGISGLTHRAVAASANVSLSSTTYHDASRDDIIASGHNGQTYLRARYDLQLYAVNQPAVRASVRARQDEIEGLAARLLTLFGARRPDLAARVVVAAVDGLRLLALTTGQSVDDAASTNDAALAWLADVIFA